MITCLNGFSYNKFLLSFFGLACVALSFNAYSVNSEDLAKTINFRNYKAAKTTLEKFENVSSDVLERCCYEENLSGFMGYLHAHHYTEMSSGPLAIKHPELVKIYNQWHQKMESNSGYEC